MKLYQSFLILCILLFFTACSCFQYTNTTNKSNKLYKKGMKQAKKLQKSADALLNATAKYKVNVNDHPIFKTEKFAKLSKEDQSKLRNEIKNTLKKARRAMKKHIEKINQKVKSIKAKAAKMRKQLRKGKKIAKKAKALRKLTKKRSRKNKTVTSFISTNIKKIKASSNKPKSKSKAGSTSSSKAGSTSSSKAGSTSSSKAGSTSSSKAGSTSSSKAGSKPAGRSTSSKVSSANNAISGGKLAHTCVKAFFDSLSPSFCWKKNGDVGIIPTGCPPNYFRHHALCFENCRSGYDFDGGALCKSRCDSGWDTHPLTCFKWWHPVRGRHTYFPHSITNFDAPCPEGLYKSGALCYRNCEKIGLVNCGIGMCAASSAECGIGISQMAIDTIASIGKGVAFVVSFGTSSVGTQAISKVKQAIKNSASTVNKAVKSSIIIMKNLKNNPVAKKTFLDKAMSAVKNTLKGIAIDKAREKYIEGLCAQIHENQLNKATEKNEDWKVNWEKMDVLGVTDIAKSCNNPEGDNAKVECANKVMTTLDNFDPTGLTGLAMAFTKPTCDV